MVLSHTTTGALPHDQWGSTARSGGAQRLEYSPAHPDPNSPTPIGLTWEERGGAGEPITVATEPISVLAWVRYPKISTHVGGHALAWTRRAVYVEWQSRGFCTSPTTELRTKRPGFSAESED